ncbi:MAG: UbiD family decarboxylase [Pigmentiphaga sp.]|uniref:UbiD family decarboxylase n=1 Tax=Pigmentiphaga sp. TaxID=1977564 RepID=UPI0029A50467|nr:UbiD family decarboxylase [Pigmentiphaga sp.]MDX3904998.1 UbiD family decarboxylase [Pigmentiphaga sp.]
MTTVRNANGLDLRRWLDQVGAMKQLKHVSGADWRLELGAIAELNVKKADPKALLFDDIPGYAPGYRVLTCTTSNAVRLAHILRLGEVGSHGDLVARLRGKPQAWKSRASEYPPVEVAEGKVFENVMAADALDVAAFPAPLWHEKDGGRYIGTGCMVVTRDLDSDWVNVGTYRVMVHDRNHVGLDMIPGKHGAIQYDKHVAAGKPFPVAIVLGCDPLGYTISGIEVPYGMCEYNYIGAILGQPVEVVRGQVTGLPFPSCAEIVLEGWAQPGDMKEEGPFGEFHGYYPGKQGVSPVVTIERIYYRSAPILLGSPPAKPPNDYSYSKAVMRSALLMDALQAGGVPDVQSVWAHEIGGARMFNVVSIRQRYPGHARQAGHLLLNCGVGAYMSRWAVVVDEDIDPANLQEVMWAVATRADPERDIDVVKRGMGSKNDPMFVTFGTDTPFNSKAVIDACRPYDYLGRFPEVAEASKALQAATRQKWGHLLEE